ncbi:MAG: hypothetical protein WD377_03845 [Nitriliruptoraceae bacterium]
MTWDRPGTEGGFATIALPMLCWFATLAAIVVIDIGAYLLAAAHAQSAADNVVLAAVNARIDGSSPHAAARQIADASGGRIEACDCGVGRRRVEATVSVAVDGLVLPSLVARRIRAEATAAEIVEPVPPG